MIIYKSYYVDDFGQDHQQYYIEEKITLAEYKRRYRRGYRMKRNQKLITVRNMITEDEARVHFASGAEMRVKQ